MAASFDYAVVRLVPRVERGEFLNVGIILFCRARRFLQARIELDQRRLSAMTPLLDLLEVEQHLALIPLVCAGGPAAGVIGALSLAERWHWLVAPRSTMIQTSEAHSGLCTSTPVEALEFLFATLVQLHPAGETE